MRRLVAAGCQALFVVLSVGLSAACGSEGGQVPRAAPTETPPRVAVPEETPAEREAVVERVDVSGWVATDLDEPIGGRTVRIVDARGARYDVVTDGRGRFATGEVAVPYDLVVAPGASSPATVHLGLLRPDPYIEIFERDGPTPSPARQTIRVGVRAPGCGASCRVTVVTTSPSGAGTTTVPCGKGDGVLVVDVAHGWRGLALQPDELIDVHVLVDDASNASFAYARIDGVASAPGDTLDVGVVAPEPVPATDAVDIGAKGGGEALVDWSWTTSVALDVSGARASQAPGFVFAAAPAASLPIRLPLIPRVEVRATVSARHPQSDARGAFHRSTEVWSGARPLSVHPIALELAAGPEMVRPETGGSFSQRGLGFEWSAMDVGALYTLTVVDTARGGARFRVLTAEHEVPLGRLAQLGLPKLDLGDHIADLSASPRVEVADAASPDPAVRRQRQDRTRPGVTTRLRIPFQVTR